MKLADSHIHFFARRFFRALVEAANPPGEPEQVLQQLSDDFGFDLPSSFGEEHARRWLGELDRHEVERAVFFASLPAEIPDVLAAAALAPERISVFSALLPTRPDRETWVGDLLERGVRGFLLFPAAHHYQIDEVDFAPLWRQLESHSAILLVHCGILKFPLQEKLGQRADYDLRLGNPLSLMPVAMRFPGLRFIIPHFGAGFLREALMVASQCENVYLDTSSSNIWRRVLPSNPTLAQVFERSLDVVGPERVIFGTDSSTFPRGWRQQVYQEQSQALAEIGASVEDCKAIFHDNLVRLLDLR